jgi:hypothetical protein
MAALRQVLGGEIFLGTGVQRRTGGPPQKNNPDRKQLLCSEILFSAIESGNPLSCPPPS